MHHISSGPESHHHTTPHHQTKSNSESKSGDSKNIQRKTLNGKSPNNQRATLERALQYAELTLFQASKNTCRRPRGKKPAALAGNERGAGRRNTPRGKSQLVNTHSCGSNPPAPMKATPRHASKQRKKANGRSREPVNPPASKSPPKTGEANKTREQEKQTGADIWMPGNRGMHPVITPIEEQEQGPKSKKIQKKRASEEQEEKTTRTPRRKEKSAHGRRRKSG